MNENKEITRRMLLNLPLEERRRILSEQAERMAPLYEAENGLYMTDDMYDEFMEDE